MEEGRDCGRRDHLLYHETAVAVGRPPLARSPARSLVRWFVRFEMGVHEILSALWTNLARPPARSAVALREREGRKEGSSTPKDAIISPRPSLVLYLPSRLWASAQPACFAVLNVGELF